MNVLPALQEDIVLGNQTRFGMIIVKQDIGVSREQVKRHQLMVAPVTSVLQGRFSLLFLKGDKKNKIFTPLW